MAQLSECLRLYLPDALAGHAKVPSNLFQRTLPPVLKAEPEREYSRLALVEGEQDVIDLLLEDHV